MRKNNLLISLFLLLSLNAFAEEKIETNSPQIVEEIADPTRFFNAARLQILNKTTAKTSIVEIRTGEKSRFGSLNILVRKCWQAPLDQRPESKILIDVSEVKISNDEKESENRIFYGWLFASSPSISGLEHPIYDIVAIDCKGK